MLGQRNGAAALWYTLGPATIDLTRPSLRAGANGIRYTFSFATPDVHIERARRVAGVAADLGVQVYSIADLPGEKFRLGSFPGDTVEVAAGDHVAFGAAHLTDLQAQPPVLPIQDEQFLSAVTLGTEIVVGDGGVQLCVVRSVADGIVMCEVVHGGSIENNRGLTLIGGRREPRALTDKDVAMLDQILSAGVFDAIALSFVGDPADLKLVRERIRDAGRPAATIAKIETRRGVDRIGEICELADIVMAARGDLALAVGPELLYAAVSHIAASAGEIGRPWILATQLLEGLDYVGYPTRAELTDTIGWLERGAAGAMLSRETVFGSQALAAINILRSLLDAPRTWEVR